MRTCGVRSGLVNHMSFQTWKFQMLSEFRSCIARHTHKRAQLADNRKRPTHLHRLRVCIKVSVQRPVRRLICVMSGLEVGHGSRRYAQGTAQSRHETREDPTLAVPDRTPFFTVLF